MKVLVMLAICLKFTSSFKQILGSNRCYHVINLKKSHSAATHNRMISENLRKLPNEDFMTSGPSRAFSSKSKNKDTSNFSDFVNEKQKKFSKYVPSTPNQKIYSEYLKNNDVNMIICSGSAGSGKTLFACTTAINELKAGNIQKIVLTRPVVSVEEDIGFLPGTIESKMDPWTKPFFDIILEYYTQQNINSMIQAGVIEISPLAFMRGRTFKNSFIIADEMQNSSPNQMLMLATRIGENSKLVITGDLDQSDLDQKNKLTKKSITINGLKDIIKKIKKYNSVTVLENIKIVEMKTTDIKRSKLVTTILNIYDDSSNVPEVKVKKSKKSDSITNINKDITIDKDADIDKDTNINKDIKTNKNEVYERIATEKWIKPVKISDNDCALIPKYAQSKHFKE
jgi:phosphate starvation-inducible PhoH-like protein